MLVVLILAGVLAEGIALFFGGWMLLGASYGQPGTAAAGALLVAAPAVLTIGGIIAHRRLRQRGSPRAGLAIGIPLVALVLILGGGLLAAAGTGR